MRWPAVAVAAVAVLAAAPFLLVGLGASPFDDPGEGMHAEIARELARSGDPFDLRLGGVRYVDKPPLLYGLLAVAFTTFGRGEATARAVPALAALLAVGTTAWLGARLLGPNGGLLAGVALLSCPGFFAYGRYVRPETLFVAAIVLGLGLVIQGLAQDRRGLVTFGFVAFGVAGLAKDPLGIVAPPLVVGLALGLARRLRPVARWLPWAGVLLAVTIGLGWWALTEARTPGFAWYTVVDNHLLNLVRARHFPDEDVPLGWLAFLITAMLAAAPWSLGALVATSDLARRRAWREPREFGWVVLALWATAVLGLTALSPFRLPHYGLPAYPMLALLAARAWREARGRWLVGAHAMLLGGLAIPCLVAWHSDGHAFMARVGLAADVATRKSAVAGQAAPLPEWPTLAPLAGFVGIVLAIGAVALLLLLCARATVRRVLAPAVLGVISLAMLPAVGMALARVSAHRAVVPVATTVAREAATGDVVAYEGPLENSGAFEWYAGRRPVIVDGRRSVLGFGGLAADARDLFWEPERLRAAWAGPTRVWVVTTREPALSITAGLPGARLVTASGTRWLWTNR